MPNSREAGLTLSHEEGVTLRSWAQQQAREPLALRSRIILACAKGKNFQKVADELGVSRSTVVKWRGRFEDLRLDGLLDSPRTQMGREPNGKRAEEVRDKVPVETRKDVTSLGLKETALEASLNALAAKLTPATSATSEVSVASAASIVPASGEHSEEPAGQTHTPARRVAPAVAIRSGSANLFTRRLPRIVAVLLVILLVVAFVRLSTSVTSTGDGLLAQVGNQGSALIDLRQSMPISPYLFGANVFPKSLTSSLDQSDTGFMSYSAPVADGLRNAQVKLLRFPGGKWSEEHVLSYDQLNAFGELLAQTGAEGMIQARLSGPIGTSVPGLESLAGRADLAGRWVDFMNNPKSSLRTGAYANAVNQPARLWAVGNEPDLLVDPGTNKPFTVADYVTAFIQFSTAMHTYDPTAEVFGPEISRFQGVGAGPTDAQGQLWMDGFLKGVGAYESAHPELGYHLLDGVSFHFYPVIEPRDASTILMANAQEWNYVLTPLHQLVRQDLGRDAPIAVTEINTNATGQSPPQGLAALWWADTLGTLMNQGVDFVSFFSAEGVDSPYPLFTTTGLNPTSMLRVFELFAHLQHDLVPVASQRDPISIYATQDDAHQVVSLMFVNKGSLTQFAQVSPQNQPFGISTWSRVDITLPPYGVTVVTMHRGRGAEAYSFKVATGADSNANVAAMIHTVCGHKTDSLATGIPC